MRFPRGRQSRWRRSAARARCIWTSKIGSLEVGKQADLVLIGTGATHSTPMYNVYSQLVYALNAHDVLTVVIAGKIVMEVRVMMTMDKPEILAKAHEYQRKVAASLIEPPAI